VICAAFDKEKRHDFRLFKASKARIHPEIKALVDSGYQGLQKRHKKTKLPHKKRKKKPLTKEDKKKNRALSQVRVAVENVIGALKRFKILAERYQNRRKRFGLRVNLIAGIYNWSLLI
jgi:IS5 family transposase